MLTARCFPSWRAKDGCARGGGRCVRRQGRCVRRQDKGGRVRGQGRWVMSPRRSTVKRRCSDCCAPSAAQGGHVSSQSLASIKSTKVSPDLTWPGERTAQWKTESSRLRSEGSREQSHDALGAQAVQAVRAVQVARAARAAQAVVSWMLPLRSLCGWAARARSNPALFAPATKSGQNLTLQSAARRTVAAARE